MTVAPTYTRGEGGAHMYVWNLTTANPTGDPIRIPGASDKTVQFDGTIASGSWGGATAQLQGSLDDDSTGAVGTFLVLKDANGNALTFTSDGIAAVTEGAQDIRPKLTTAGTNAAVRAILMCRNTRVV